jgi:adenine-specific DNA methylase
VDVSAEKQQVSSSERLSVVARKDLGAFYTPTEITQFATEWAVRAAADVVLDPGCGDAAFLVSAAHRLRQLGASSRALSKQITGIDLNRDAVQTAARELTAVGAENATLINANFFDVGGDLFGRSVREVDALVGNPPYVRYQLFRDDNRAAGLRAAARAGVILPQLTSSWAPFVVHASTFIRRGGRLALVLPGELLHVGYAAAVRDYLLRTFSDLTIITFEEKVFPGALEEVVIVLGVKGEGDGSLRVRRLESLRDLADGPNAVLSKARRCAVAPGARWLTTLLEEDAIGGARDVIERAKYTPLGELARVDIGVVTGANDFFVLGKAGVVEHKLPVSYLLPVISKAAHVQGARFTVGDWSAQLDAGDPSYLLVADEKHGNPHVARYLEQGEKEGIPSRYKCRVRQPWYRVPYIRKPDLFLTYMSNIAPRLVVNEAGASHTNTVHGVFLSNPLIADALAAAFLNSATLLSTEMEGRSYGGGVLKLEPGEAVRVLVPRLTPSLVEKLRAILPKIDALVRAGQIDEASALVDRIVLGKNFKRVEIERIRSVLSSLRARRLARGKTAKGTPIAVRDE